MVMVFRRGTVPLSFPNPERRHGKPASRAAPGRHPTMCCAVGPAESISCTAVRHRAQLRLVQPQLCAVHRVMVWCWGSWGQRLWTPRASQGKGCGHKEGAGMRCPFGFACLGRNPQTDGASRQHNGPFPKKGQRVQRHKGHLLCGRGAVRARQGCQKPLRSPKPHCPMLQPCLSTCQQPRLTVRTVRGGEQEGGVGWRAPPPGHKATTRGEMTAEGGSRWPPRHSLFLGKGKVGAGRSLH